MSRILFINPLGHHITLQVIQTEDNFIVSDITLEKTGNDFDIIPEAINSCVKNFFPTEIWCICGPGPFTLMRILTLAINSISYAHSQIQLRSAHYFDLIPRSGDIPILTANRHEYLIRSPQTQEDIFIEKDQISEGTYTGYIDDKPIPGYTEFHPTVANILTCFAPKEYEQYIFPLYIKPPNITQGSKKNTHLNL